MSYKLKPNYHFSNGSQLGIDKVPIGRIVVVEDFGNNHEIIWVKKKSNFIKDSYGNITGSLTPSTTINEAINGSALDNPFNSIVDTYSKTEIESMTSLYRKVEDSFTKIETYDIFREKVDSYSINEMNNILDDLRSNSSGIIQGSSTINNDITILPGNNAISFGPITLGDITVTISNNSVWKII